MATLKMDLQKMKTTNTTLEKENKSKTGEITEINMQNLFAVVTGIDFLTESYSTFGNFVLDKIRSIRNWD